MSYPAELFDFDGERLSAAEVKARVPIYSITAIRAALKSGASCIADLHQAHAEGLARRKAGSANNQNSFWRKGRACSSR